MLPAAENRAFLAADLAEEFDELAATAGAGGRAPLVLEAGLSVRAAARPAACRLSDHIANDVGRAGSRARGERPCSRAWSPICGTRGG